MSWHTFVRDDELIEPDYLPATVTDEFGRSFPWDGRELLTPREERRLPSLPEPRPYRGRFPREYRDLVLREIAARPGCTMKEIATVLGIPRTSANSAALTLLDEGAVRRSKLRQRLGGYTWIWEVS